MTNDKKKKKLYNYIPWTGKRTNLRIMKEAGTARMHMNRMRNNRGHFCGHMMRGKGLYHITNGKLEQDREDNEQVRDEQRQPCQ